jgi:hypothetical protein
MRTMKEKVNASMWLFMSLGVVGGEAIRAIDPIESERPNTRSERVSILGLGLRFSAVEVTPNEERSSLL